MVESAVVAPKNVGVGMSIMKSWLYAGRGVTVS